MFRSTMLLLLSTCIWAGMSIAQDLWPPSLGTSQTTSGQSLRPPARPAEPELSAISEMMAISSGGEAFGPPPPPRWFLLRETDQEFDACRLSLAMLGTVYKVQEPIRGTTDRDCGIARPLMVQHILPDLELQGGAIMRCDTARALGFWARDFLRPAAATLPAAPRLTALQLGSGYDCRDRIGSGQERLSEHALGNAIDISGFLFDSRDPILLQPRDDDGDQSEAFQRAARGAACLFFTTVLGPGTNAAHDDHLHLDMAARNGGWRLCQ